MATLLKASVLSDDEKLLLARLNREVRTLDASDALYGKHYEGSKRLTQIGIAVPPELRVFETVANWNATVVDEVCNRLDVKGFIASGEDTVSENLRAQWEANNMDSEAPLLHNETSVYGRGYVSVGTNPEDAKSPLIRVEPTRQMVSLVSSASRSMIAGMRHFKDYDGRVCRTLMLPDSTLYLARGRNGWEVTDRDDHKLGRVPLVLFLNRRRAGDWHGSSEMTSVIPLVEAAARALTNLQLAQEGLAVPSRWIFGVDPSKMVDPKTGEPIPVWEAYFTSIMVHQDKDVKAGQFQAADLKNFTAVVNHYGSLVASLSGLPLRYFTESSVNPAAEGAIRADESRLVKNAERKQTSWGDGWGWVMGLSERYRTGEWTDGNKIHTEWHDAGTPTESQKADAIQKLNGGVPVLSREGSWDQMDWTPARKDRERKYFQDQLQAEWAAMEPASAGE